MSDSAPPGLSARAHHWQDLELGRRLAGGHRSEVAVAVHRGRQVVVRRSHRPPAALEWEIDLLDHLASEGVRVPRVLRTDDGRRHVDGVTVREYLPGRSPTSPDDWARVRQTLALVHGCTTGWAQRPGFASSRELQTLTRGGDVRLDLMPSEIVGRVRATWAAIDGGEDQSVVHGDPGPSNIRVTPEGVGLLDWDEARVDLPAFDHALLPIDVPLPEGVTREDLVSAGLAWEVATCWVAEPAYAARRHAELVARSPSDGPTS